MTHPVHTVPFPRRPLDPGDDLVGPPAPESGFCAAAAGPEARTRHWYENDLGWATVPGRPLRLLTGVRFDVLDVPAEAGARALRHLAPGSPVALRGDRMQLLVAAGGAEELPGLLDWLEWSAVTLDLRALGPGCAMEAPGQPPGTGGASEAPMSSLPDAGPPTAGPAAGSVRGAAVWLRPPGPGGEAEASLPVLSAVGRERSAPDLVRLVDTVAAECHRVRLRRACAGPSPAVQGNQPLAFS
ncbi:SCO3374 family protein [Streptomyces monashensis]|uniref:SCO3374 family protein n=1 Tax=Streptomyces monashensis TaxID=1678012 RepID=UPI0033D73D9D